jgi:hypothetical protein
MPETTAAGDVSAAPVFREAFKLHSARIRAVPNHALRSINVEPVLAQQVVSRVMPKLQTLKPRLLEEFTKLEAHSIDELPSLCNAYGYATIVLRLAEPKGDSFEALATECSEVRSKFADYARAAISAGLIQTSRMDELKNAVGYRNLMHDLLLLTELLHSNWSKIESKCFFTKAEVDRAENLVQQLTKAIVAREARPSGYEEANLERQRAFTLFINAYNYVRNRVWFLLKEDGLEHTLEDVMPSLNNASLSGKRRGEKVEVVEGAVLVESPRSAPTPPVAPKPSSRIGMPDSDPFLPD